MGKDSLAGIRTSLHQQANHRGVAAQNCIVNRPMFVVAGAIHRDQFRATRQHRANANEVTLFHRRQEMVDVGAVDKRF